jgi:hypothetical protein
MHETDDILAAMREAHRVAFSRVVILEWQDEEQTFGPPLDHRLSFEKITSIGHQVGFKDVHQIRLTNLVLYRIEL